MKIALLSLMIFTASATIDIDGIAFPATLHTEAQTLQLSAGGSFTYALIFDVLCGASYLPSDVSARDFKSSSSKALILAYKRDFSAEEFRTVTSELFRKNNPDDLVQTLSAELKAFNTFYEDIKAGDRYQLTLLNGSWLELRKNDRVLGTIQNPKFGDAIFNVWFGDKPMSSSLKRQLLKES